MKGVTLIFAALVAIISSETAFEEFRVGNIKFAAEAFKKLLNDHPNNLIFSPLSVEIVLALTQNGASGTTSDEFTSVLHLPTTKNRTREALKSFVTSLKGSRERGLKLFSANKLFPRIGFDILESFKNIAVDEFEADIENVDYSDENKAAAFINKWVEDHTNDKIKNLVSPDMFNEYTRLVLVNAVYFDGKWEHPFSNWSTYKEKFYTSAESHQEVDMMLNQVDLKYYEDKKHNVKFVEMPYKKGNISMTVILPNEVDGLATAIENIEELLKPQPLAFENVEIRLPKFVAESLIPLKSVLEQLGLKKVFTDKAELIGITAIRLKVDDIFQKAFIDVSESGTEAAASTVVVESIPLSGPIGPFIPPKYFRVDRPFIYYITYEGVILFLGKITQL